MAPLPKENRKRLSDDELETAKGKNYKSPQRKLILFFEKSRNQWKAKCFKAKATSKILTNRVHFLERSRDHWKRKVKELERQLILMKVKERAMEEDIATLKKSTLRQSEM